MGIGLTDKIEPKNDGFVGMVDADQVIGASGAGGYLPSSTISGNSIQEYQLKISNSPSDTYFLQYKDSTDKLTWAEASAGDVAWSGASDFYGFSSNAQSIYHPSAQGDFPYISTQSISGVTSDDVIMSHIGDSSETNLTHWFNLQSAGYISGGSLWKNDDGTINMSGGTGMIKTTDSEEGQLQFFNFSTATNIVLTDNSPNWIYVDYNGGTPIVDAVPNYATLDYHTQIIIGRCFRDGTDLYPLNAGQEFCDYSLKNALMEWETAGTTRAWGMVTTESGNRGIDVTQGKYFVGHNGFATSAKNGEAFHHMYYSGGSWYHEASVNPVDNTYYNPRSGSPSGLQELTVNKYGVRWVYAMDGDGELHVVYDDINDTLSDAIDKTIPAIMPEETTYAGIFIAKIIVQKGADNLEQIILPWTTSIGGTAVTDHGALGGLNDDDHPQYYNQSRITTISSQAKAAYDFSANSALVKNGFAQKANSQTITHGLGAIPTHVSVTPSGMLCNFGVNCKVDINDITVYMTAPGSRDIFWEVSK